LGKLIFDASAPGSPPTMTIWRVEEEDGQGPYGTGRALYNAVQIAEAALSPEEFREFERERDTSLRPSPRADFEPAEWLDLHPRDRSKLMFGFASREDAYKWFGPVHMKLLKRMGAKLVRRQAKKVFLSTSGSQLVYIPAN
jgi:hypothetical protein